MLFPSVPPRCLRPTVLLTLLTVSANALAQEPRTEPLRVAEVLAIPEFADRTPIDLSPDGGQVAFTMKDPRRAADSGNRSTYFGATGVSVQMLGTDVYVADTKSGHTRRVSDGRGASWGGVWSPDGRYLAFYSDRDGAARVWLWDRAQAKLARVSGEIVRPFWGFEQLHWSPDGRRLLVKLIPEGMSLGAMDRLLPVHTGTIREPRETAAGVTARVYTHAPGQHQAEDGPATVIGSGNTDSVPSAANVQLGDLALIDVASGQVQRIARRVRAMGYRFSATGEVAFSTFRPDVVDGVPVYDRYDLWVTGQLEPARLLARIVQNYGLQFSWSPTGKSIAYASAGVLHVLRVSDGSEQTFTDNSVALSNEYRAPLWLDDKNLLVAANNAVWRFSLANGRAMLVSAPQDRRVLDVVAPASAQHMAGPGVVVAVSDRATKRVGFQRIDLAQRTSTPLYEADVALGWPTTFTALPGQTDGLLFVAENSTRPPELWRADSAFAGVRRLTNLHASIGQRKLGTTRLLEWTGASGARLQGVLLLPAGYLEGRRYPLVVKVYGGISHSDRLNRFGLEPGIDNLQLLATRGYAVLLADAPAHEGTPMSTIADAVVAGANAVIAMGVADPERLAIFGHSYGGYSALGVAVQSSMFRAVISSGGISNLLGQYAEMREDGNALGIVWSEHGQGRMGGSPWQYPERYHDNSPFFFLQRITAPVLLLHGGSDSTVLPQRARETFVGLRRLGKEVKLVIYEGEEHHPSAWSSDNAADYWQRIFECLSQHLVRNDVQPDSSHAQHN